MHFSCIVVIEYHHVVVCYLYATPSLSVTCYSSIGRVGVLVGSFGNDRRMSLAIWCTVAHRRSICGLLARTHFSQAKFGLDDAFHHSGCCYSTHCAQPYWPHDVSTLDPTTFYTCSRRLELRQFHLCMRFFNASIDCLYGSVLAFTQVSCTEVGENVCVCYS